MDLDYVSVCQKKLTRNQKKQNNQVDDKVWLSKTKLCNGQNLPTISNDNSRYEDEQFVPTYNFLMEQKHKTNKNKQKQFLGPLWRAARGQNL